MEAKPRELLFYETATAHAPCREWLDGLEQLDKQVYGILMNRLDRVEAGNFGDCGPVGEGVSELVIDTGPGYRIYFGQDSDLVVLLLAGTKRTQTSDIKKAKGFWRDYNA